MRKENESTGHVDRGFGDLSHDAQRGDFDSFGPDGGVSGRVLLQILEGMRRVHALAQSRENYLRLLLQHYPGSAGWSPRVGKHDEVAWRE